jgi:hypothetical protein
MSEAEMQKRIKLELRTPLEQFLLAVTILSPVFIFIGYGQMDIGQSPALMVAAILVCLTSALSYFFTDNYYLLDLDKNGLYYRFKFYFIERLSLVAPLSGIHAVTIDVKTIRSKSGHTSYYYVVTIVLSDGRVMPVSDMKDSKAEAKKLADFIVKASGADFVVNSGATNMIAVKGNNRRYTFKPRSYELSGISSILEKALALISILVLVPFIAAVVYYFLTRR